MSTKRSSQSKRDRSASPRVRGVILTVKGWQKLQFAMQAAEVEQNWGQHFTREQLSERTGLSLQTISRILKRTEAVDRLSIEYFLRAFELQLAQGDCAPPGSPFEDLARHGEFDGGEARASWNAACDVSAFFGREAELAHLREMVLDEHCRSIALLGIGGMGKSALSVKLAQDVQSEFEAVIWRSLSNAPPLEALLNSILSFLLRSQNKETLVPTELDEQFTTLIDCLQQQRCLLILDNTETLLSSGNPVGQYRSGYEVYGQLLRLIGETAHQSCLLLTSREKPGEIALLEGEKLAVRSLQLQGLSPLEGRLLFEAKGNFIGTDPEWSQLIEHYRGNPLALKLVAAMTQEFLNGDITEVLSYIEQGKAVFSDIRDLLARQFDRLSTAEQEVILWLAINREPVPVARLSEDILTAKTQRSLPDAIQSLLRRSMIEQGSAGFSLQPVVMEYVTERLIEQVGAEIIGSNIARDARLRTHALMKAQSIDFIRETQIRLIVQPLLEDLLAQLGGQPHVEQRFRELLAEHRSTKQIGYLAGNLLNLLVSLKTDLQHWDFSNLALWQADLRRVNLAGADFQHSDLAKSAFAETLSGVLAIALSPDGTLLATGDVDNVIHIWRVADFQPLLTLQGHTGWVWSVCFSSDGQRLASGATDAGVRLWDVQTGDCLHVFQGHTDWVWNVQFSPDQQTLASSSTDALRLWNLQTRQCEAVIEDPAGTVAAISFSPDGRLLASGSQDGAVRLWEVCGANRVCIATLQGHSKRVRSVCFSADGSLLVSGSEDSSVCLWDVQSQACLQTFQGHKSGVWSVAFSPDGQMVASSADDFTVRLWDVQLGHCLQVLQGHGSWVLTVQFSDSQTVISGSVDFSVRFWDVQTGQCLNVLQGHKSGVFAIEFAPTSIDSERLILASGGLDAIVRLWDVKQGVCVKTLQGHTNWIRSVSFNAEGTVLASAGFDRGIRLWNMETGQCLKVLQGHTSGIRSVCFGPDGQMLASGGFDWSDACKWWI
ncbi:NB-ARC domain-containing protein [Phormidesmis sp. 146-12]